MNTTKTTAPVLTPSTRHITRLFRQATAEQVTAGRVWYLEAYAAAVRFSRDYGVTVDIAAGVLAATSPLNSWGANVRLAERVIAAGGTLDTGYLGTGLRKANAILAGADIERTLNGLKTINFYRSIRSYGMEGTTIDRHSWSVAVNHRYEGGVIPSLSGKRYEEAAECYRRAARILSKEMGVTLSAAVVQAVTWVQWRNKFWSEGAWD